VTSGLGYAIVTPVRDEEANLERLAGCVLEQTVRPTRWVIVDNGSADGTPQLAERLAAAHEWIDITHAEPSAAARPGAPIVRAFKAGLRRLESPPEVVVKLDADVSMPADYFERVLAAFTRDEQLGITGGTCYELDGGEWRPIHVTANAVRGASRCYRRECLEAVSPLEERMGWDGLDELKASVLGWRTGQLSDVPFYHHRAVGERDGLPGARWFRQGAATHYMGYRFSYILLRSAHHGLRHPTALLMIAGYVNAAVRGGPRYQDDGVRAYLRDQQRLRRIPVRLREAFGKRA
jgi:glycosyltransferase involved in cell wall biosynthesis